MLHRRKKPRPLDDLISIVDDLIKRHERAVLSADQSLRLLDNAINEMEQRMCDHQKLGDQT